MGVKGEGGREGNLLALMVVVGGGGRRVGLHCGFLSLCGRQCVLVKEVSVLSIVEFVAFLWRKYEYQ